MKRVALLLLALAFIALVRELRRPYDEARLFGAPPANPRRRSGVEFDNDFVADAA